MIKQYALGFGIAFAGAFIANAFGMPIPWMLGALIFTAICRILGVNNGAHKNFRKTGQLIVGVSIGLYFSPQVNEVLIDQSLYIIAGSVSTVFLSIAGAWFLYKFSHQNFTTAYFASTVGGASEMVVIAERKANANLPLIASAHSLRILIVVVTIPFIYQYLGIHGNLIDMGSNLPVKISITDIDWNFFLLFACAIVAGFLLQKIRFPNAWLVGTMLFTAVLTSHEIHISYVPVEVQRLGQILLGWALGSNYGPHFFKQAPKFIVAMFTVIIFYMLVMTLVAYLMSFPSQYELETLVLGLSPGGLAEIAVTAKDLQLGAPVVVAFQIVRLVAVLLLANPLFNFLNKFYESKHKNI